MDFKTLAVLLAILGVVALFISLISLYQRAEETISLQMAAKACHNAYGKLDGGLANHFFSHKTITREQLHMLVYDVRNRCDNVTIIHEKLGHQYRITIKSKTTTHSINLSMNLIE